ncbi:hypothetical protein GQ55_2G259700 [Panicum hallii var. hallii]|uniref:Uncharacterized protein n=1 Tax=Panicum hallii var. hallii TaxID=1504633 RepID=A0A2T7ESG3_9POAL|nr:hypothetical protein GQ55_2G259700 [Panicum hallii var. hallii]
MSNSPGPNRIFCYQPNPTFQPQAHQLASSLSEPPRRPQGRAGAGAVGVLETTAPAPPRGSSSPPLSATPASSPGLEPALASSLAALFPPKPLTLHCDAAPTRRQPAVASEISWHPRGSALCEPRRRSTCQPHGAAHPRRRIRGCVMSSSKLSFSAAEDPATRPPPARANARDGWLAGYKPQNSTALLTIHLIALGTRAANGATRRGLALRESNSRIELLFRLILGSKMHGRCIKNQR